MLSAAGRDRLVPLPVVRTTGIIRASVKPAGRTRRNTGTVNKTSSDTTTGSISTEAAALEARRD